MGKVIVFTEAWFEMDVSIEADNKMPQQGETLAAKILSLAQVEEANQAVAAARMG